MKKDEYEKISSALEDCKYQIEKSFDKLIEEIKKQK